MSARSERRAAEIAVIDAAVRWVKEGWAANGPLREAVTRLERIGLDETRRPQIGNNTTDTSAEAGASVLGSVGPLARTVYDEIAYVSDNGGVGLTVDQIEQILRRSHQSVSARVNELRDKGWVTDSGQRRETRSGRKAITWTPTFLARTQR